MKKIVKIEMTDKILEEFEFIQDHYGISINTEVIRVAITMAARLLRETLIGNKKPDNSFLKERSRRSLIPDIPDMEDMRR